MVHLHLPYIVRKSLDMKRDLIFRIAETDQQHLSGRDPPDSGRVTTRHGFQSIRTPTDQLVQRDISNRHPLIKRHAGCVTNWIAKKAGNQPTRGHIPEDNYHQYECG
jgi:hypothetical protein